MKDAVKFFKKLSGSKVGVFDDPSARVVSILIKLDNGTTLEANNPVFERADLEDDIQMEEIKIGLPDGAMHVDRLPRRMNMTLKVTFRLFTDKTGNFVWLSRPAKPPTFFERMFKSSPKGSLVSNEDDWVTEE